jgi:hypothetical protein
LWIETGSTNQAAFSFKGFVFDSASTLGNLKQMVSPYYSAFISLTGGSFALNTNSSSNVNFETVCTSNACDLDYAKGCLASTHCSSAVAEVVDKDIKIVLGFQGTDKDARFLVSANSLPHKYRFFSFSNVYNDVVGIIKP